MNPNYVDLSQFSFSKLRQPTVLGLMIYIVDNCSTYASWIPHVQRYRNFAGSITPFSSQQSHCRACRCPKPTWIFRAHKLLPMYLCSCHKNATFNFFLAHFTVLHIFTQVLLWAGNQGNHQNFDPSSIVWYQCDIWISKDRSNFWWLPPFPAHNNTIQQSVQCT